MSSHAEQDDPARGELLQEMQDLKERLREAEETLQAIRSGEVDALVVSGQGGESVFTLKGANYAYRIFVESINEGAATVAADGTVLYCNGRFAEIMQQTPEAVRGARIFRFLDPEARDRIETLVKQGLQGSARGEVDLCKTDGSLLLPVQVSCRGMDMEDVPAVCLLLTDLTERKRSEAGLRKAYEELRASQEQLREQAADLERKNVTMRELIGQIAQEKREVKEDVAANIRDSVLPILEKFRVEDGFAPHVKAIRRLLEDLASPYSREMAKIGSKLTLKEIDVCRMIRGGLTSKEIADSMNVSTQTVEKHRKSIRRKLGIANKPVELGSFLNNL